MENKKIDVLFGVVVIAFLVVTFILIKDFKTQRASDFKDYQATVKNIVKLNNDKIKILSNQLVGKQRENQDLKNTLADTRNELDALSKKLAQPSLAAAPAAVVK